ncbi:hypothetical protein ACHAW5_006789 [Stephanodiscus triporus]|uniref:Uncharacterized protein n=1 Tax=Stephanodiscus triporus TaxID=2934178 RepID=A0ABD3PAD5_9STRA
MLVWTSVRLAFPRLPGPARLILVAPALRAPRDEPAPTCNYEILLATIVAALVSRGRRNRRVRDAKSPPPPTPSSTTRATTSASSSSRQGMLLGPDKFDAVLTTDRNKDLGYDDRAGRFL